MGGDIVAGTNIVDGLKVFEKDEDTHAIIIAGEVGGRAEQDAAEWIKDYRSRVKNPKYVHLRRRVTTWLINRSDRSLQQSQV